MEKGVWYNTYAVPCIAQPVFSWVLPWKTNHLIYVHISLCFKSIYTLQKYVVMSLYNITSCIFIHTYVLPTHIPALENLIKHSCSHGLLLLIAKALLTDCNINRNFPVGRRKKQKHTKIKNTELFLFISTTVFFSKSSTNIRNKAYTELERRFIFPIQIA